LRVYYKVVIRLFKNKYYRVVIKRLGVYYKIIIELFKNIYYRVIIKSFKNIL